MRGVYPTLLTRGIAPSSLNPGLLTYNPFGVKKNYVDLILVSTRLNHEICTSHNHQINKSTNQHIS